MSAHPTRPILRWPGRKTRMLKHLLPLIPEHVCYCEPFAGSLAVLLAKERSEVEIVNDLNGDIVALYRNLQYHLPELMREIEFAFAARRNIKDFMANPGLTEIQRAVRFLVRNKTSFGGNMDSFGVAKTKGGGVGFSRAANTDLLGAMHQRMDKVVIENLSYERCLANYDSKDSFFFMDPPYLNCRIKAYAGWDEKQMTQFRRDVDKLKGRWVITLDASEFNQKLFADCKVRIVESRNGSANNRTHSHQKMREIIITPA
jgi:DNA adenine methylase